MLGAVVAAATGRPLADYCAEKIWGLPAWRPTATGRWRPRIARSWTGPASACANAT